MANGFQRFQAAFLPQPSLLDQQTGAPQGGLLGRMDPTILGLATGLLEAGAPTVGPSPGIGAGLARGLTLGNQFAQQRDQQNLLGMQMLERQQAAERQRQLDARRQQALQTLSAGDPMTLAALQVAPGQVVGSMMPQEQEPTAMMQNVLATLPPDATLEERREALRQAVFREEPGTTVTVNPQINIPPEEAAQRKENAKFLSQTRQETEQAATSARRGMMNINRAKQLIRTADPSAIAPLRLQVQRFLAPLGVEVDTSQMGAGEALQAIGTDFVLDQVQRTKGAISNAEMQLFARSAPGLARSREGNLLMLELLEAKNKRDIDLAKLQREYARDNNGLLDFGWFDERDRYIAQNPLFTEDVRDRIDQIAGEDMFAPVSAERQMIQPQTGRASSFADRATVEELDANGNPTGKLFVIQDGKPIPVN